MNIVTCEFFLKAEFESSAPLKKITEFNPDLKLYRNSFSIERNGIKETVKPMSFNFSKDIENGINTVDFFPKNFLKEILKKGLLAQSIRYEATVGKTKGYILEGTIELNDVLQTMYNEELKRKAEVYFGV